MFQKKTKETKDSFLFPSEKNLPNNVYKYKTRKTAQR